MENYLSDTHCNLSFLALLHASTKPFLVLCESINETLAKE